MPMIITSNNALFPLDSTPAAEETPKEVEATKEDTNGHAKNGNGEAKNGDAKNGDAKTEANGDANGHSNGKEAEEKKEEDKKEEKEEKEEKEVRLLQLIEISQTRKMGFDAFGMLYLTITNLYPTPSRRTRRRQRGRQRRTRWSRSPLAQRRSQS